MCLLTSSIRKYPSSAFPICKRSRLRNTRAGSLEEEETELAAEPTQYHHNHFGCKKKPKVAKPTENGGFERQHTYDNIQRFFASFRKGLLIYFYIMCLQLVFWGRVPVFLFSALVLWKSKKEKSSTDFPHGSN